MITIYQGDALERLKALPSGSVHCAVTSPPYWNLRDYDTATWNGGDNACDHIQRTAKDVAKSSTLAGGNPTNAAFKAKVKQYDKTCRKCGAIRQDRQIGRESSVSQYVENLVVIFRELRRVLRSDGVLFLNLGDSYSSGGGGEARRDAQRNDTSYREPLNYRERGSVCSDLCDGCASALASRIERISRPRHESSSQSESVVPRRQKQRLSSAEPVDEPRVALESTTHESSRRPQGECSHCANCGACLFVLRSSSRDARLCARTYHVQAQFDSSVAFGYSNINKIKSKDLLGVPWMLAFALRADGWYLRSDICWEKPNVIPESVTDRPTCSHEYVFLFAKSPTYFYDWVAVRERGTGKAWNSSNAFMAPKHIILNQTGQKTTVGVNSRHPLEDQTGRNLRNTWTINTEGYDDAHFAAYPPALVSICVKAGTSEKGVCSKCGNPWVRQVESEANPERDIKLERRTAANRTGRKDGHVQGPGGRLGQIKTLRWQPSCTCQADRIPATVLDCFGGAGTTALVANRLGRDAILIELNASYTKMAKRRIQKEYQLFPHMAQVKIVPERVRLDV